MKLREVLRDRRHDDIRIRRRTRDGETHYFEGRAVLVSEEGVETGISIAICDYTERKRLEREILDVSSRERHAIGRDLHDGLGQELTGVSLMVRSLATHLERECPRSLERVNEIADVVKQCGRNGAQLGAGTVAGEYGRRLAGGVVCPRGPQ